MTKTNDFLCIFHLYLLQESEKYGIRKFKYWLFFMNFFFSGPCVYGIHCEQPVKQYSLRINHRNYHSKTCLYFIVYHRQYTVHDPFFNYFRTNQKNVPGRNTTRSQQTKLLFKNVKIYSSCCQYERLWKKELFVM